VFYACCRCCVRHIRWPLPCLSSVRHMLWPLPTHCPAPCQHMLASALLPILDVVYVTCGGLCQVVCCRCCVRHIRWPLPCLSSGMPSTSHVVASAHTLGSLIPGCLPPAGTWSQRHLLASLHGRLETGRSPAPSQLVSPYSWRHTICRGLCAVFANGPVVTSAAYFLFQPRLRTTLLRAKISSCSARAH
jgi:hypothetical protein